MNAGSPPEESCGDHLHIIDDNEFVAAKQLWQVAELLIFHSPETRSRRSIREASRSASGYCAIRSGGKSKSSSLTFIARLPVRHSALRARRFQRQFLASRHGHGHSTQVR